MSAFGELRPIQLKMLSRNPSRKLLPGFMDVSVAANETAYRERESQYTDVVIGFGRTLGSMHKVAEGLRDLKAHEEIFYPNM